MNKKTSVKETVLSFLQLHEDDTVQIGKKHEKTKGRKNLEKLKQNKSRKNPERMRIAPCLHPPKFSKGLSREASDPATPSFAAKSTKQVSCSAFSSDRKGSGPSLECKGNTESLGRKSSGSSLDTKAIQVPWERKTVALPWEARVLRKLRSWMSWI